MTNTGATFVVDFTKTVDGLPDAQARWEYARFLGAPCEGAAFRELCRLYRSAKRQNQAGRHADAAGAPTRTPAMPTSEPATVPRLLKQQTLSFVPRLSE